MPVIWEEEDGALVPLEGRRLQEAREELWEDEPTFAADAYLDQALTARVEILKFFDRFCSLIWLHRTITAGVTRASDEHARLRQTGQHRVPGWEGESDLGLDQDRDLVEEAAAIGDGAIIAATAAALESLTVDLLDRPGDTAHHRKGLQHKIETLIDRWPFMPDIEGMRDDIKWIAERRNSFAHNLLDEASNGWRIRKPWTFDNAAVEEAFARTGNVAARLAIGWERHLQGPARLRTSAA